MQHNYMKQRLLSLQRARRRVTAFIDARPMMSFALALLLLLVVIALGNAMRRPAPEESAQDTRPVRTVDVYTIGQAPQVQTLARIDNTGVVTLLAQTSGVVQSITAQEGNTAGIGSVLLALGSTYDGQNAAAVQQRLAYSQYAHINDTYDLQAELINNQRELAEERDDEADAQREIAEQSLHDTNDLLDLNEDLLSDTKDLLDSLDPNDLSDANQAKIAAAKAQEIQLTGSVNQLKATRRSLTHSSDDDEHPSAIAELSRDITLKQLDLQEASLDLARDSAWLQVELANVAASLMMPTAPLSGVVEKVHVTPFQQVSPGTPLITLHAPDEEITAEVLVSRDIAQLVAQETPSRFTLTEEVVIGAVPTHVSTSATDGPLHSVLFTLPGSVSTAVTDGDHVSVALSLQAIASETDVARVFVPLEVVHHGSQVQAQEGAAGVFVLQDGAAAYRAIDTGPVRGRFIEVRAGIAVGDQVIVQRNVVNGAAVTVAGDE